MESNQNGRNKRIVSYLKPVSTWALYIGLFLILRYTGVIAAVSTAAQGALLQTGAMDVNPRETVAADAKRFDYDFELYDANRQKVNVSDFKGKTLFINLWATWCGPCRVEMPSIQNLYDGADKQNVVFIMLALDQNDPLTKVDKFIQEKGYSFPVYFPAGNLPELLRVRSIPATFVVDKEGTVVHKQVGAANYDTDEFKSFLRKLAEGV